MQALQTITSRNVDPIESAVVSVTQIHSGDTWNVIPDAAVLRGTALDLFGRSAERRLERKLIADYEAMLDEVLAKLTPDNHHVAVGLAAIPEKIRGFGHIKMRHLVAAKADEAALLEQFRAGPAPLLKAAE